MLVESQPQPLPQPLPQPQYDNECKNPSGKWEWDDFNWVIERNFEKNLFRKISGN